MRRPCIEHHAGGHYARPIGGSRRAWLAQALADTRSRHTLATLSRHVLLEVVGDVASPSPAPVARLAHGAILVLGARARPGRSPRRPPAQRRRPRADSRGTQVVERSSWRVPAALRTRLRRRCVADDAADCGVFVHGFARAVEAYSPTVSRADDAYSPTLPRCRDVEAAPLDAIAQRRLRRSVLVVIPRRVGRAVPLLRIAAAAAQHPPRDHAEP